LAGSLLPWMAYAQPRTPTVGLLWIESTKPSPYLVPLEQGLRKLGYKPGQNIRLDERFLVERYEDITESARRLVAEKPDVIVVYGGTAALALQKATATIPVVIATSGDPVTLGLVKSLSRPGTNFTGLTAFTTDLSGKRLELLKAAFPRMRRVAVALYPLSESEMIALKNYEAAARERGIEVRKVEIRGPEAIQPALASVKALKVDAIAFIGSTMLRAHAAQLVTEAAKTGLPAIYTDQLFTELGGVMSYGPDVGDNFRGAATYIDRILKGAKPADMPVVQSTQLPLVINLKAAKAQGLDIPREFLLRADRVID
jgi:putative ABC transport system substrate-binding protein